MAGSRYQADWPGRSTPAEVEQVVASEVATVRGGSRRAFRSSKNGPHLCASRSSSKSPTIVCCMLYVVGVLWRRRPFQPNNFPKKARQ
jgi:hypothetical protein